MKDSEYGPLNMTVRVQENNLLNQQDYEQMLAAHSYEEALRVLSETPYRQGIEQALATKDYEAMVTKQLKDTYQWIIDESPNLLLSELMVLSYSYHNIKILFKEELTGQDFADSLIDIGIYPIYEFRRAVRQGQSTVLPALYLQNIRNLRSYFTEPSQLSNVDIFVDRAYIHHLKRLSEELNQADIYKYVETLIDHTNVSIFFRALAAGLGKTHLQATITNEGSIHIDEFIDASQHGLEGAIQYFTELSDYRAIMAHAVDSQGQFSLRRLEQALDNATETYLEQAKFQVFGPLPVLAFISAKEIEVKNIRLVLTGQINNIEPERIRDRMRLDYAI